MGTCSSPMEHSKKIKKVEKEKTLIQKNSGSCYKSKNAKSLTQVCSKRQSTKKVSSQQSYESYDGFPLAAFGYIVGQTANYCLQRARQTVGLGCLISKNIILASDHYLHYYNAQELSFKPCNHSQGDKIIKIKSCIYPASAVKQKRRSTYLHKRLGFALYQLEETAKSQQIIELGINIQEENSETDDYFFLENVIQESSRLYFSHRSKILVPERGWPLLYKLYDRYYCVGLYSSAQETDYLLFNQRIVQKFKFLEEKHCGTELISYIEIVDAKVEVPQTGKIGKPLHILQDLMNQLETAESQHNKEQTAEILFKIGVENGIKGDLDKEKQYYHKSLELYLLSQQDQKENIASLYHNLGVCESQLGFNEKGKKHLLEALQLKMQLNLQGQSMGDTYNELGVISKNQKKYDEAMKYYNKAFTIYSQLNYTEKIGLVLNNINIIQQEDQTYSHNLSKFLGALSFLIKSKGERCLEVAQIYYNLACMESDCKNYGSAMTYLSRSLNIMKNLNLQGHYKYKTMIQSAKSLNDKAIQFGLKRQWILKGKALLRMI